MPVHDHYGVERSSIPAMKRTEGVRSSNYLIGHIGRESRREIKGDT